MSTTGEPPVTLLSPPERGVWRLGKRSNPVEYNLLEPATSEGSSAGRFSLATYGMLYCASDPDGCYAEALAYFRVGPEVRATSGPDYADWPAHLMKPGHLPQGWRQNHSLVRLVPAGDARFLDVDSPATREWLTKELHHELKAWDVQGVLGDDDIHGRNRQIARQIAAWTVAQRNGDGHRLAQGIAYRSGYGGRQCWAVLSDVDLVRAETHPIRLEDGALQDVAREYGLRLF
ncbi:RES domain-containing protein [Streptomyces yaizuensis]|uniref:RES domain-containing protein n=1 Tax=Streptomyces yaizuensis TaxID=2989713 RepID=A0ABQ5P213_9ACTN|nr:RES domain-containing protein [Streptomyces sp. YSPA8]GLF96564.1 RES domain-containing protein [Streptomyces sp. YSPA8]